MGNTLKYLEDTYEDQLAIQKLLAAMLEEWINNKMPNDFEDVVKGKRVLKKEFSI